MIRKPKSPLFGRCRFADRDAEIVRRGAAGEKPRALAAEFGISVQRAYQIVGRAKMLARRHQAAAGSAPDD